MKRQKLHPVVSRLLAYANGATPDGIPSDLFGTAANRALMVVLQNWQVSLAGEIGPQDLVGELDEVIGHLQAFKAKAATELSPRYGGTNNS